MTQTSYPYRCSSCGCNAVQRNGFCNWCGHDHNDAPAAPAPVTGRYGGWPTKDEYVNLQTGEILPRPAATTRCHVEMDYYFGRHTGTVEVVIDVTSTHALGTKAFEDDALQAGYNHGDAGMFCVAGCNGLRVTPVGFAAELTPERDGEPDYS